MTRYIHLYINKDKGVYAEGYFPGLSTAEIHPGALRSYNDPNVWNCGLQGGSAYANSFVPSFTTHWGCVGGSEEEGGETVMRVTAALLSRKQVEGWEPYKVKPDEDVGLVVEWIERIDKGQQQGTSERMLI